MKFNLVNFAEIDKFAIQSYCRIHNINVDRNLGDVSLIDTKDIEDCTMLVGGSPCLTGDTLVLTQNKGYIPLKDIKIGDFVLSHDNQYHEVINFFNQGKKITYMLSADMFHHIRVTENHKFYIREKLKESRNGKCYIQPNWIEIGTILNPQTFLKKQYLIGASINQNEIIPKNENELSIFSEIELKDSNTYYELGFNLFNSEAKTKKRELFISDNRLFIPTFIIDLPQYFLQSFLDGIIDSYAQKKNSKHVFRKLNLKTAYGLGQCIMKAYHVPYSMMKDNHCNGKETFKISFKKNCSELNGAFYEKGYIWYPIKGYIKNIAFEEVFDISVKDSMSFTANNCIVHNCQDYSIAGKQNGAMYTCKNCGHKYNPLEQHYSKRDTCPCCGSKNIEITRSSLIVHYLRILREKKPNMAFYENVKNLQNKEFRPQFDMFLKEVEEYGYNVYWKVLNAKDFGVPQNRERIYVVMIKKELDNGLFEFPKGFDSGLRLKDICSDKVDEKYYIKKETSDELIHQLINENKLREIKSTNEIIKVGSLEMKGKESIKRVYSKEGIAPTLDTMQGSHRQPKILCEEDMPKIIALRGRYYKDEDGKTITKQHAEIQPLDFSNTLTTIQKDNYVCEVNNHCYYVRKLTPKECSALMGFTYQDYINARYMTKNELSQYKGNKDKLKKEIDINGNIQYILLSDNQCYKQAGNSIVVNILLEIYKNLYKVNPKLFEDIQLCSLFSGIGAFESALERLK